MLFKKYRLLLVGMIIGCLCTLSTQVFAISANAVTAWVSNLITIEFDGEIKPVPEGDNILTYRDHIYVPVRFVAENLGADVDWDYEMKRIKITSPKKKIIIEEKKKEEEKKEPEIKYEKMPVTKNYVDMLVGVTAVVNDDYDTRIYVTLENKKNIPLQLLQSESKIKVDGREYSIDKVTPYKIDKQWYQNIKEDQTAEGYIIIPKIPKDAKEMHLVVKVLKNDRSQEKRDVEFNISL